MRTDALRPALRLMVASPLTVGPPRSVPVNPLDVFVSAVTTPPFVCMACW